MGLADITRQEGSSVAFTILRIYIVPYLLLQFIQTTQFIGSAILGERGIGVSVVLVLLNIFFTLMYYHLLVGKRWAWYATMGYNLFLLIYKASLVINQTPYPQITFITILYFVLQLFFIFLLLVSHPYYFPSPEVEQPPHSSPSNPPSPTNNQISRNPL